MAKKQFVELFAGGWLSAWFRECRKRYGRRHKTEPDSVLYSLINGNQVRTASMQQMLQNRCNLMPTDNVYESKDGDILRTLIFMRLYKGRRIDDIPDFDVLGGGFPCQDYSVLEQPLGN